MEFLSGIRDRWGMWLVLLACVVVGVQLTIPLLVFRDRAPGKEEKEKPRRFDERQERVQGQAARGAFWVTLASLCIWVLLETVLEWNWDLLTGIGVCVSLGLTVYAWVCIFRDAWSAPDTEGWKDLWGITVLAFLETGVGMVGHWEGWTYSTFYLVQGVLFMSIPAAWLGRTVELRMELEMEDEEEDEER